MNDQQAARPMGPEGVIGALYRLQIELAEAIERQEQAAKALSDLEAEWAAEQAPAYETVRKAKAERDELDARARELILQWQEVKEPDDREAPPVVGFGASRREKVIVEDRAALLKWAQANAPEWLELPSDSDLLKRLHQGAVIANPETGEREWWWGGTVVPARIERVVIPAVNRLSLLTQLDEARWVAGNKGER